MAFNPDNYMIKLKGKDYLPVAGRLVWFREDHPDWGIVTEPVAVEADYSIFKACIFDADGKLMATAHKKEDARGFPDHMEKAETGSIGRALALCGYGTQFADEFDEGQDRIVDSPQQRRQVSSPGNPFGADAEASNVRSEEVEDYGTLLRDFIEAAREAGEIPNERQDRAQLEANCIRLANMIEPERPYKDKMPNAVLLKKMRTHFRRKNGQAGRKDRDTNAD